MNLDYRVATIPDPVSSDAVAVWIQKAIQDLPKVNGNLLPIQMCPISGGLVILIQMQSN